MGNVKHAVFGATGAVGKVLAASWLNKDNHFAL
jgi:hypothetical protein